MLAPVLCQPSFPVPVTGSHASTFDIAPTGLAAVRDRCEREGLTVMGLRFRADRLVPGARFAFLRRELWLPWSGPGSFTPARPARVMHIPTAPTPGNPSPQR
ncbi:hypothetical protein [Streptomyces sp. WMMC897]|uniref:hypothetical protein n=1 Tax=Streptomyces sp. WMMC897 TaxID=3014782 RepID=UPI0022B5FEAE|nr:hypothetical protein [Streptomyces sp. WMMC897]MCZ7417055.1 hypothetical protein [Streptomyces sp. WMMC897]